jgi:ADP-ribose pyrophosphatase YjhB (NUDIX family)
MLSFQISGYQFHLRAAAVVIHDGSVLLHRAEADDFWALPGGRVDAGEDAASAVAREMTEEVSETVECGKLCLVVENFFAHQGRRHHEVGLYFRARLADGSGLLDKTRSHPGKELEYMLEYRWFPLTELENIDIRPRFLQACLSSDLNEFRHVVYRDAVPAA